MMRSLCLAAGVLTALVGCAPSGDAQLAAVRSQFVLSEEPAGALGVLELPESLPPNQEVVLVGQIGGVPDPWTRGQASFVVVDPIALVETGPHGAKCDCAFCKSHQKSDPSTGRATVQFVHDGQVLGIDARKLFDVEQDQMVVVRGRAARDSGGNLIVAANGIYVRR